MDEETYYAELEKKPDEDGTKDIYSYISTHVDDFLIISTNPEPIMEEFKKKFQIRNIELSPTSYLGLQWEALPDGAMKMHNEKYIKEVILQLE